MTGRYLASTHGVHCRVSLISIEPAPAPHPISAAELRTPTHSSDTAARGLGPARQLLLFSAETAPKLLERPIRTTRHWRDGPPNIVKEIRHRVMLARGALRGWWSS